MSALRFIVAVLLVISVCGSAFAEKRSAKQWQTLIDNEKPVAYDSEAGSILGSLKHYCDKGQVHMIYDSEFPRLGDLTIKFIRNNKDVLVLKGHLHSVFRDSGNTLYFADFRSLRNGCAIVAYDLSTGKQLWRSELQGIGQVNHSKYWNSVNMELDGDAIRVRGYESFGNYVEILDAQTGRALAHRIIIAK